MVSDDSQDCKGREEPYSFLPTTPTFIYLSIETFICNFASEMIIFNCSACNYQAAIR